MLSGRMVPSSVSCLAILTWRDQRPAHLGAGPDGRAPQHPSPGQRWLLPWGHAALHLPLPKGVLVCSAPGRHQADTADLCIFIIPPQFQHNTIPSASPAIPQDPAHRLRHFLQVSFGVLVSFLSSNHEGVLLPFYVPEDDGAAVVISVVEHTGFRNRLRTCSQPPFIELLGWELANALVLAEKKGETEVNKTQGTSQPAASFWAGFTHNAILLELALVYSYIILCLGRGSTNGEYLIFKVSPDSSILCDGEKTIHWRASPCGTACPASTPVPRSARRETSPCQDSCRHRC